MADLNIRTVSLSCYGKGRQSGALNTRLNSFKADSKGQKNRNVHTERARNLILETFLAGVATTILWLVLKVKGDKVAAFFKSLLNKTK